MSRHHVSRMVPALFHPELAAHNGGLPNAAMLRRIANTYNAIASRQRKFLFLKWQDFRHMLDVDAISERVWPFYFRTGENVDAIDLHVGVCPSSTPGLFPVVDFVVKRAADGVTMNQNNEGHFVYQGTGSGTGIGPEDISHTSLRIRGLAGDTEYYVDVNAGFGMRLAYLTAHETMKQDADDSSSVIVNPARFVTEGPVRALDLQKLNFAAKNLWKHNASHLFSWCPNYQESDGPTTSSTSYVDLVVNSASMMVDTTNRGTLHRPDAIPVKIAVKAMRTAGVGGTADFRLFDGSNSVAITGAVLTGSAEWFTGTGVMSGTPASWRMQHRVSTGAITLRTHGWSLFQWEA